MNGTELWNRYKNNLCICPDINLTLDISRMTFPDAFFADMAPKMHSAYDAMDKLEAGVIANPDENRMVGHYWLRAPKLAPTPDLAKQIQRSLSYLNRFVADVHNAKIKPPAADRFTDVLIIGIGGSALGPQFVADALGYPATDKMRLHFIDNTDPDGIARTLDALADRLNRTLVIVISKSGGTPETRNGMIVTQYAYEQAKLDFSKHAVAVTGVDSSLDKQAVEQNWITRFPMWDWVGGRTSETATVGLLPAALQGIDIDAMLEGAAKCDVITRNRTTSQNPAALLALMWYHATDGRGAKDMVILPYKDRLVLLSRYLQQLIMESLGKAEDLDGNQVNQGIAVYGNKGSTDQHAYVQQLREGVNNFFATFIEVQTHGGIGIEVEPGVTSGDYLNGFLLGTREALYDNGRQSMTITVRGIDAFTIGVLIAIFERAVGFYASLVNINAYHQPGVQAGKLAAANVLKIQHEIFDVINNAESPMTVEQIAIVTDHAEHIETIYKLLETLVANNRIKRIIGDTPFASQYHKP